MEPLATSETMDEYQAIMASDLREVDKVKAAFELITGVIVQQAEQEIDLLRAVNDRENLIKEQIKLSTVRSVRAIFAEAYRQATGCKLAEARDER